MDRLFQLIAGSGGKQSRAGFFGQLAKISLIAAGVVSGLSLSVAEAINDCCPQLGCIAGVPQCPSNGVPSGYIFETNCGTCCLAGGGCVSKTQCNVWKDPNSATFCYTASVGSGTCPCAPNPNPG